MTYEAHMIEKKLKEIMENPSINDINKEYAKKTVKFLYSRNLNDKTVLRWLEILNFFFKDIKSISVEKITKDEIEDFLLMLNTYPYKESTKVKIKSIIKAFFKHFFGEDMYYPKQVAWIKTTIKNSKKLLPHDLLTEDEIIKMIETANNLRDKAILSLLYDSGIRAGELLNMKVKDIDLNGQPAHILVNGKTGERFIPIMFSVPYIASYLNAFKNLQRNDYLWQNFSQSNYKGRFTQGGLTIMLKRIAKAAKINKNVHPHLFRHSRASDYANKLTEQQLKAYFGWAGDSKMASVYVHLSGRDIDNAVLKANGINNNEQEKETKLTVKKCERCGFINPIDATYCNICGTPLNISTALTWQKTEKELRDVLLESIKDPKLIEEMVHRYLEDKRKKRKR